MCVKPPWSSCLVFLLTSTISSSFWLLRTRPPPCLIWLCMILLVSENYIAPTRALFPGYSWTSGIIMDCTTQVQKSVPAVAEMLFTFAKCGRGLLWRGDNNNWHQWLDTSGYALRSVWKNLSWQLMQKIYTYTLFTNLHTLMHLVVLL